MAQKHWFRSKQGYAESKLKFARDRRRWLQWVFHAKKRFGLKVLNYMLTCNHIHLLVADNGDRDTIPNGADLSPDFLYEIAELTHEIAEA